MGKLKCRRRHNRPSEESSAIDIADKSFNWYARHAREARRDVRMSELALLITGAMIPTSTALTDDARVPALLGALVVILTGLRPIFHWNDNWLRFTEACIELETQRRFYLQGIEPYNGADKDTLLIRNVRGIEAEETRGWAVLRASQKPSSAS
jgi:hypothetical protein